LFCNSGGDGALRRPHHPAPGVASGGDAAARRPYRPKNIPFDFRREPPDVITMTSTADDSWLPRVRKFYSRHGSGHGPVTDSRDVTLKAFTLIFSKIRFLNPNPITLGMSKNLKKPNQYRAIRVSETLAAFWRGTPAFGDGGGAALFGLITGNHLIPVSKNPAPSLVPAARRRPIFFRSSVFSAA
jgi:hypothetical protein